MKFTDLNRAVQISEQRARFQEYMDTVAKHRDLGRIAGELEARTTMFKADGHPTFLRELRLLLTEELKSAIHWCNEELRALGLEMNDE